MQHFWGQDLESRLEWMLNNSSSLSVPHEKFTKCHRRQVENLGFPECLLDNHNIQRCEPVPGTQLDKLEMIWRVSFQ